MQTVNILLVDDDEEDYLITRDLLDDLPGKKFYLTWEADYGRAKMCIREKKYDVYLVDYRIGVHSGLELIREAVAEGCTSPLILLTGQGNAETDELATQAGAADYLVKGTFNANQLERAIRYSLEHARHLQHIRQLNSELERRVAQRTRDLAEALRKLEQFNDALQRQVQERLAAEESLRESQRLFKTIGENFPNGSITVLDRAFRFVYIDGKELADRKLDKQTLLGKNLSEFLPEEQREGFITRLTPAFGGESIGFEYTGTENQFYAVTAVPLSNGNGEITQILLVTTNITERKRAEEETRRALTKERELGALKSKFVTMASHEFRTPLSTIASSASLIARYNAPTDEEKRKKHVDRIQSAVNNLTGILNDFLSISKLEEGKVVVNPAAFELVPFVEEVSEEISILTKEGQRVHYRHLGEDCCRVTTDRQLLKNVLLNLLSNAIKYSSAGQSIELTTQITVDACTFTVQDHGIGIPQAEQAHLFSQFFRAHNVTNIQGTGLGLTIVKKYVDMLGGSIEFESIENEGTTFTVRLPVN